MRALLGHLIAACLRAAGYGLVRRQALGGFVPIEMDGVTSRGEFGESRRSRPEGDPGDD
jgi:hypothetical protein